MAYQEGVITLQARIKVRRDVEIDGEMRTKIIDTTIGRIIFNNPIPQDLGYVDRSDSENLFKMCIRDRRRTRLFFYCHSITGSVESQ